LFAGGNVERFRRFQRRNTIMSLGAISEPTGTSLAPLNSYVAAAAKTQATTDRATTDRATTDRATTDRATTDRATGDRATAQSATGAAGTKPPPPVMAVPVQPLSPAVLAELVGLQLPF
jgi:hypothetical protein